MNLHKDKELFEQLVFFTSGKLKIEPAIIEKDYYVTLVLKVLAEKQTNMVFRGGTSLSKCYKLIKRFSEDIDLNIETDKATEGMRKALKENIISAVSELDLTILNLENIQSRRHFNRYEITYPTVFDSPTLKQALIIETAVHITAFPTVELSASSLIYDCLQEDNRQDIISEYRLEPFKLKVLAVERTFIDKIFAIGDYYLSGRTNEHSRHIYDLYKLLPLITFNQDFKLLFEEVRLTRKSYAICLSAQDGVVMRDLLQTILDESVYKNDYERITRGLLFEDLDYETVVSVLRVILVSGVID